MGDLLRFYAGIGSRATPRPVLTLMTALATSLEDAGYRLRSGAAAGADAAFESGVRDDLAKEIYLPWKGFNESDSRLYLERLDWSVLERARKIASRVHPAWNNCSPAAKKLHTRNVLQILGWGLEQPADFVICWTKGGGRGGGTGQALRLAETREIPIYDLALPADKERLYSKFDWSGGVVGDSLLQP